MLKSENRLKILNKEINEKKFSLPFFTVKISQGEKNTKFGFVVSKKVSKSAVIRNKTKRVLRDAVKELVYKIRSPKNIIIISKKDLEFDQKEEVARSFSELFKKAGIMI